MWGGTMSIISADWKAKMSPYSYEMDMDIKTKWKHYRS